MHSLAIHNVVYAAVSKKQKKQGSANMAGRRRTGIRLFFGYRKADESVRV